MTPMDNRILEVLQSSGLVLSPSIISYNLDVSREAVNRRLKELTAYGMVEKVDRGKYEISEEGRAYLAGELDADDLERDEE